MAARLITQEEELKWNKEWYVMELWRHFMADLRKFIFYDEIIYLAIQRMLLLMLSTGNVNTDLLEKLDSAILLALMGVAEFWKGRDKILSSKDNQEATEIFNIYMESITEIMRIAFKDYNIMHAVLEELVGGA